MKGRFREASARTTESIGWTTIFEMYDDDGSGELDIEEFTNAVRKECEISAAAVPDSEIEELFNVIDVDGSGGIDSSELMELFDADLDDATMTFAAFFSSIFELSALWAEDEAERNYVDFLLEMFASVSVPREHVAHLSPVELQGLPVFADAAKKRPNFRLRPLVDVDTLLDDEGLMSPRPEPEPAPEPEPEPEPEPPIEVPVVTVDVGPKKPRPKPKPKPKPKPPVRTHLAGPVCSPCAGLCNEG